MKCISNFPLKINKTGTERNRWAGFNGERQTGTTSYQSFFLETLPRPLGLSARSLLPVSVV